MEVFILIFHTMLFGTLGSVLCGQRGYKQWVGFLLGSVLSVFGILIIRWFFKDNVDGMNDFYKSRYISGIEEEKKAAKNSEMLGVSVDEYKKNETRIRRENNYKNRNKWLDVISPFGDEGMPDKWGNTWVDYLYYFILVLIVLSSLIVFNL